MFMPVLLAFEGYESADRLAGIAGISGQLLDHADIMNTLRDIGRVQEFGGSESTLFAA